MGKSKFGKASQKSALSEDGSQQICNQLMLEEAVWHFIINHQMDEMIGDSLNLLRRQIAIIHKGFDFASKELCMEMKIFMLQPNAGYSSLRRKFRQSITQMIGYISASSEICKDGRRMIFLLVGRQGIGKDIRILISRKSGSLLKKAVDMGMELWVAEVETEAGMELLSYENMTNEMRGGMGNG